MKSLVVFIEKLGFEFPSNNGIASSKDAKKPQGAYLNIPLAELYKMNIAEQIDTINERKAKKYSVYQEIKEFILIFNSFVFKKIKKPTNDLIKFNLIKNNITLGVDSELIIKKVIIDLYFYSYIFYNKKNRPKVLNYLIHHLEKIDLIKLIDSYCNLIALTENEVNSISTIVLNTKGKQVSIMCDDDIIKPILAKWNSVNEIVEFLVDLTDKSELHVRQSISELILDLKKEAQQHFNIMPLLLTDLFKLLFTGTRNKQQVYSFMHSTLEPFFPSLHNEEEYWSQRDHGVRENRRFKQHQRDAINSLMQIKELKFFRT